MRVIFGGANREEELGNVVTLAATRTGKRTAPPGTGSMASVRDMQAIAAAIDRHSWTGATVAVVMRAIAGAGFSVTSVVPGEPVDEAHRKRVLDFMHYGARFANIKDYITATGKLHHTFGSLFAFGQCGWEIVTEGGKPVGFDVVPGYIVPNVTATGQFETPNFWVYPWSGAPRYGMSRDKMVYFVLPGAKGEITGFSPFLSLSETAIPSDISASEVYRNFFENFNSPYNGYWIVDPSVSDRDFRLFVKLLQARYSGKENFGRNPILLRGKAEFREINTLGSEDAPFLDGRRFNRQEVMSVTGVNGAKLGISEDLTKANARELRREFYEGVWSTLVSTFEDAFYEQVCVRILGTPDVRLRINKPGLATPLEQATIHSRLIFAGVINPNEARAERGLPPYEGGEVYFRPKNVDTAGDGTGTGGDLPGRDNAPERPPRDEDSVESTVPSRRDKANEVRLWRMAVLRAMHSPHKSPRFEFRTLSQDELNRLSEYVRNLDVAGDMETVTGAFKDAIGQFIGEL